MEKLAPVAGKCKSCDFQEESIDGGHWIFLTHKEEVNAKIQAWLQTRFPAKR
ncbi:hypothetical protein DSO57_1008300 [Entomophthora muscae]|nr:hypothetical protein DSO57_1008300 [Entomophthora muscae]